MPTVETNLGRVKLLREVYLVLLNDFNSVLLANQGRWNDEDEQFADDAGIEYVPTVVEQVPPDNFHLGSIPSFVQTDDRVANYPLIAVVPGRTIPDAEDARMDSYDVYQNTISIHTFARANPKEGPNIAWLRAERMAEATNQLVRTDFRLRTSLGGVSRPSLLDPSEPWLFPAEDGHGEDWSWVATGHMYQVKNYSMTPEEV